MLILEPKPTEPRYCPMDVRYAPQTAHWTKFMTISLSLIDLFMVYLLVLIVQNAKGRQIYKILHNFYYL